MTKCQALGGNTLEHRRVRAKNTSQCHCVHHKSHMGWLGVETGPSICEEVPKCQNYDSVLMCSV
jgi:hypothetical protein